MYNTPREIPVVFHNGRSYDYRFIINRLAEESEGYLECLDEKKRKLHNIFRTNQKRIY